MPNLLFYKKTIIEPSTVGLQWVGWQWMVVAGETTSPRLKNIAVAAAITANELIGTQVYGRLIDCIKNSSPARVNNDINVDSQLNGTTIIQPALPNQINYTKNQKYLKAGLASTLAGNIFYVVDNAVSAACLNAELSVPATLALRSVSVGISDMIAFQIGLEVADIIKSRECCSFELFKDNLSGAFEAGMVAVAYTLGNYIGEVVCDACGVENDNERSAINSLFIFSSTTVTMGLKYLIGSACHKSRVNPSI